MLASFHHETWTKNSPAMSSQETLYRFYVIISGRMKVSRINPDTGRELTIFLLSPGDVFDVICMLDEHEHHVEVTAIDDLETIYAPLDEVRRWIGQHPEFNKIFTPYFGRQIRLLEELASMTGSVRTVISRHMLKLNKDGIIKSESKHLEIKNLQSFLERAENHIGL